MLSPVNMCANRNLNPSLYWIKAIVLSPHHSAFTRLSHLCRDFVKKHIAAKGCHTFIVGCLSTCRQGSLVKGENTMSPEGWSSPRG